MSTRRVALLLVGASLLPLACGPVRNSQPPQQNPSDDDKAPSPRALLVPIRVVDKDRTPVGADLVATTLSYVRDRKALLGLSPRDELVLIKVHAGAGGQNHVRLQQTYEGIKVWGADIVVHTSDTTFKSFNGNLTVGLSGMSTKPSFLEDEARATAKADYAAPAKDAAASLAYDRESLELVVLPGDDHRARLAWHVVFFTEQQAGIGPGLWNYFIDAHDGQILQQYNALDTLSQASGPGGNSKVSRTWVDQLDVEPSGSLFKMDTARLQTVNMNHATSGSGTIVTGPLNPISDAPIDDAHGFAEVTLNMLSEWFGFNSIDNAGFKIRSRVHYDNNFENAFWDGTQMTYGDGAATFFPLSGAIDVVAHEIDHGFTTFHSNLQFSGMSGGMNESFSDIAGTTAEWFFNPASANFDLGEAIFKSPTGALRFMCTPSADGMSIDNASQFTNGLDPHFSSGVMNRAFCRAARRISSGSPTGAATQDGVRRTAQAWYTANANFWTSTSTFTQGCQGVFDAATSLGFSATDIGAIRDSWADVGVFCGGATEPPPSCDETLTTASGTITSPNFPAAYPNNVNHTTCIQPASGNAATLTFDTFTTESGFDFVTIRNAAGAQLSKTSGTTAPAAATSTKLFVTFTSDTSVVAAGWRASWTSGGGGNQPPTVALTAPADGATVSGNVTVSATASDSDGTVAKVRFGLPDGTFVDDTSAPFAVTWNSATVADGGGKTITAQAFDNLGATSAVASRTVTVSNGAGCVGGTFNATGLPLTIPDNNTVGIASSLSVTGAGNVGSLALSLHITHTFRGDLRILLVSPAGTQFTVLNRSGGSADDVVINGQAVTAFNGEVAAGAWQLRVTDLAAQDVGTLDSFSLAITGSCGGGGSWSGTANPNLPTVDNGQVCSTLTVSGAGNAADVKLDLAGRHDFRSILRGTLSHGGVTATAFPTNTFPNGAGSFSLTGRAVAGFSGSATGTWQLCIIDTDAFGDTGVLESWGVHN